MRIQVDRKKCSGCHLCELACSLFHLGVMNPERSAIRIEKDDLESSVHRPVVCRQCRDMTCLEGEEVDERSERGAFVWDQRRSGRCPFHALNCFGKEALHCDLCGGSPQCVRVCTTGAIRLARGPRGM